MHPFFQQPPKKKRHTTDAQLRAVTDKVSAERPAGPCFILEREW